MAGTLTNLAGATSFRFLTGGRLPPANSIGSASNLSINNSRIAPKASLHAVIDEPLVESTKMKKSVSLYEVLNVKRNATASEIKSAYRSLAKRYHPDVSGSKPNGDCEFIEIRNAYVTLSDPTARALYDRKLCARFERRSGGVYAAGGGAGKSGGFYAGRRWETDQCW
ncbi:hypothetical protein SSX86_000471 [Deinandra increscens subsp. villosa]|uniref:J domain-containing protein n=1 Tax=Deinandra increscens subsp. villosa TaxID=3103831 RepID=A0AAP0HA40_9ASTR